jgi:hypothetical protein
VNVLDTRIIILLVVLLVLSLLLWRFIANRKAALPRARFKKASSGFLADFLIPDGEDGEIHIENALLCSRGIVLISIKDVSGNVFGSDAMTEWTVITGDQRFTFTNPQDGMYDRTAAIKRIVPDLPVEGHIAFTDSATFGKGFPKDVIPLSELLTQLETEHSQKNTVPDAFLPGWEKLTEVATVVELEELTRTN